MTDDYAKRRLAELHAAAPAKRKRIEPYAEVKLGAAARAFAAMNCSRAMVWLWLLQQARMTGKTTFTVPNGVLTKYGVSRDAKRSALRQMEEDGLITVERSSCKNPIVTVLSRIDDRTVED